MPHATHTGTADATLQACIDACTRCHHVCTTTEDYCLQQGGKHADPRHITTLLDCADICATAANFMLRGSELHSRTCAVCADVCLACADSCERMGSDDVMRRCAEECRSCAESCARMARAA